MSNHAPMDCPHCQQPVDTGDRFCHLCGTSLASTLPPPPFPPPAPNVAVPTRRDTGELLPPPPMVAVSTRPANDEVPPPPAIPAPMSPPLSRPKSNSGRLPNGLLAPPPRPRSDRLPPPPQEPPRRPAAPRAEPPIRPYVPPRPPTPRPALLSSPPPADPLNRIYYVAMALLAAAAVLVVIHVYSSSPSIVSDRTSPSSFPPAVSDTPDSTTASSGEGWLVDATFCKQVDARHHPVEPTDSFRPSDTVYLSLHYSVLQAGVPLRVVWMHASHALKQSRYISPTNRSAGYISFGLKGSGPWAPGNYTARIYLDQTLCRSLRFRVP